MSGITFPVEDFFPISQYKALCENEDLCKKNLATPHFFIVHNPSEEAVRKQIDQHNVNNKEPNYNLTVVAVAVMKKRYKTLKYVLFKKRAQPNLQDLSGSTPLHYAATLRDKTSLEILQKAAKVRKIQLDIFKLFPGWRRVLEPIVPKQIEQGFKAKTGADFCPEVSGKAEDMPLLLAYRLKKGALGFYEKLISDSLYPELDRLPKLVLDDKLGVCTCERIAVNKLCGIYGGELDFSKKLENGFKFKCFNATEKRNHIPHIKDAFPNCRFVRIYHPDGRYYQGIVSLREIHKGEPLYLDYGQNHKVKLNAREELNFDELVRYFKKNSIMEIGHQLAHLKGRIKENKRKKPLLIFLCYQYKTLQSYLGYLFNTPSTLFLLALHDQTLYQMLTQAFNKGISIEELNTSACINAITTFFRSLGELYEVLDTKEKKAFGEVMTANLKQYSWRSVLSQFLYFKKRLVERNITIDEMSSQIGLMCETMEKIFSYALIHREEKIPEEKLSIWKKELDQFPLDWVKEAMEIHVKQFPNLEKLFT